MKVKLVRRWGGHDARSTVDVDDTQAEWLVRNSYAESAGDLHAPVQPAAAEGAHGADPLAGSDATRLRPRVGKPARDASRNYADPAPGSSPTYRAGFDAEASERQGEAGRNYTAPVSEKAGSDTKKPARSRGKSGA